MMDLDDHKVKEAPDTIFYIPNFITEHEENTLINQINNAPKPKWTQLSHRRLQNWGGLPHPKGMVAENLPMWLSTQVDKVAKLGMFQDKLPNHVLINEYLPGQGIMPHKDGPLFYPTVTTISCGSHTVLDFFQPVDETQGTPTAPSVSLLLEPCSLVVVQGQMYEGLLHGIAERTSDHVLDTTSFANLSLCSRNYEGETLERGTRLSLTIRHVPKTKKLPGWFKGIS